MKISEKIALKVLGSVVSKFKFNDLIVMCALKARQENKMEESDKLINLIKESK